MTTLKRVRLGKCPEPLKQGAISTAREEECPEKTELFGGASALNFQSLIFSPPGSHNPLLCRKRGKMSHDWTL